MHLAACREPAAMKCRDMELPSKVKLLSVIFSVAAITQNIV
jgi:hypothetical protein